TAGCLAADTITGPDGCHAATGQNRARRHPLPCGAADVPKSVLYARGRGRRCCGSPSSTGFADGKSHPGELERYGRLSIFTALRSRLGHAGLERADIYLSRGHESAVSPLALAQESRHKRGRCVKLEWRPIRLI